MWRNLADLLKVKTTILCNICIKVFSEIGFKMNFMEISTEPFQVQVQYYGSYWDDKSLQTPKGYNSLFNCLVYYLLNLFVQVACEIDYDEVSMYPFISPVTHVLLLLEMLSDDNLEFHYSKYVIPVWTSSAIIKSIVVTLEGM